jgi:hypothetical protein
VSAREGALTGDRAGAGVMDRIYRVLPRPRCNPTAIKGERLATAVLVLRKGENPTYSYYLEKRIADLPVPVVERTADTGLSDISPDGLFVIICRYVGPRQMAWLERHRDRLAGVAYFVDDDIAALLTSADASWAYRGRLARQAILPLRRLNRLLTHLWVSTPALRSAFASSGCVADVLAPAPRASDHQPLRQASKDEWPPAVAFHATEVHRGEHEFLMPILTRVAAARPDCRIEVVASGAARLLWERHAPRQGQFDLLAPMSWPAYHDHSRRHGVDIFLVPLLESRHNAARADTKRIDCVRLGAAAIFSSCEVYGRDRRDGELHIPNAPDVWVRAILDLLDDEGRRAAAAGATRQAVLDMAGRDGFPGVRTDAGRMILTLR